MKTKTQTQTGAEKCNNISLDISHPIGRNAVNSK